MQGFTRFEGVDMFADRYRDATLQYLYKFFAFVVIVDTFMRLLRFNGDQKGLQMLVFRSRG